MNEVEMQLNLTRKFKSMRLVIGAANGLKRFYMSYPYTRNPEGTSLEVQEIVQGILDVTEGVYPFVPHFAIDMLFDLPAGYTHEEVGLWEAHEIAISDFFVYDPSIKGISAGVRWEKVIAEMLGKPVLTVDECKRQYAKMVRRT